MLILRVSSSLSNDALLNIAAGKSLLLLCSSAISSKKQLELAFHLAKKSFGTKNAIANKFHLEFLLWLSGCKDIRKAFEESSFRSSRDILVISFAKGGTKTKKDLLKSLSAKEKKLSLSDRVDPLALESISLSRI